MLFTVNFGRTAYKILFSWWLTPLLDRHYQKAFADEIKQAAPFLFLQYEGRVIPAPRPEMLHPAMSHVTISASQLVFQFSRWRSESYGVRVSPSFAPNDSYDLIDALRAADPSAQISGGPPAENWSYFAQLLQPRFILLQAAFSQQNFPAIQLKLAQLRLSS